MINLLTTAQIDCPLSAAYELLKSDPFNGGERQVMEQLFNAISGYKRPTTRHLKRSAYQWLSDACADKNEVRHFLQELHASDGWMIGADGHRLHAWRTDLEGRLPKAPNRSIKQPIEVPVPPSDFTTRVVKVFTDIKERCERMPAMRNIWQHGMTQKVIKGKLYIGLPDHDDKLWWYSYEYLYAAAVLNEITYYHISNSGELLIDNGPYQAVIMPVKD
jgi:hypothetical protein